MKVIDTSTLKNYKQNVEYASSLIRVYDTSVEDVEKTNCAYVINSRNEMKLLVPKKIDNVRCLNDSEFEKFRKKFPNSKVAYLCKGETCPFFIDDATNQIFSEWLQGDYAHYIDNEFCSRFPEDIIYLSPDFDYKSVGCRIHTAMTVDKLFDEVTCTKTFITKEDLDKYFIPSAGSENLKKVISGYFMKGSWYFAKKDFEELTKFLKIEQPPLIMKGEELGPFYFKVFDKLFVSTTKNWFSFVSKEFFDNQVFEWMLVPLKS